MHKVLIRIGALIFLNLIAFLFFGTILGAIFGHKEFFLLTGIGVSIIPLTIIMFFEVKKANNQINNISKENKYDGNSNGKNNGEGNSNGRENNDGN